MFISNDLQWSWKMEWCRQRGTPPSKPETWERATQEWEKFYQNARGQATADNVEEMVRQWLAHTNGIQTPQEWAQQMFKTEQLDVIPVTQHKAEMTKLRNELTRTTGHRCPNGHTFWAHSSHPAKSEQEWFCPNCLYSENIDLRKQVEKLRQDVKDLNDRMIGEVKSYMQTASALRDELNAARRAASRLDQPPKP